MYGSSRYEAALEIDQNNRMVAIILARRRMMIATPIHGACRPKNTTDHNTLSTSCKPNIANAGFFDFLYFATHTRYKLNPISKYNTVQTGPNSQLGGLKNGLSSVAYHVAIFGNVTALPTAAATKGTNTDIISLIALSTIT